VNKLIVAIIASFSLHASASPLIANCSIWSSSDNKAGQISLDVNVMLVDVLNGDKEARSKYPSVLTVVNAENRKLLFHDELSHLNLKKADGSFPEITKKLFPIEKPEDISKPRAVEVTAHALKFSIQLKTDTEENPFKDFTAITVDAEQTQPGDGTFLGDSSVTYKGKKYNKLHTNCSVWIDFGDYQRMKHKLSNKQ
jgi:hypothetical protein